MYDDSKKDETFETIEILENAILIYNEGDRAIFEAIFLTNEREIISDQILTTKKKDLDKSDRIFDCNEIFIECGGILKENIKYIKGGTKRTVFKKILNKK